MKMILKLQKVNINLLIKEKSILNNHYQKVLGKRNLFCLNLHQENLNNFNNLLSLVSKTKDNLIF
jgi:hypothetical protein